MTTVWQITKWELRASVISRCGLIIRTIKKQSAQQPPKLMEVGHFLQPKDGRYDTGQLFLHKVFGYRGIILFPWTARVYDRDLNNPIKHNAVPTASTPSNNIATSTSQDKNDNIKSSQPTASQASNDSNSENKQSTWRVPGVEGMSGISQPDTSINNDSIIKGKVQTFYQVLIDNRDCPYIRAQTEAVTFLGHQDSNLSLYAIPGLDHVAHEDVMPYSSTEKKPLQHDLFDKFLTHAPEKDPPFIGQEALKAWKEKNHPWLDLNDVHKETTEKIRITVIPFYMGLRETPVSTVYWWRYCIRLENLGELSVQLRERHWRIFSLAGTLETVRGRGVVGQEPILSPRLPAFQYSSHVSLQSPSGHMWGTFRLEREDGYSFDCKIPPFSLESKVIEKTPPTNPTIKTKPSPPPIFHTTVPSNANSAEKK